MLQGRRIECERKQGSNNGEEPPTMALFHTVANGLCNSSHEGGATLGS